MLLNLLGTDLTDAAFSFLLATVGCPAALSCSICSFSVIELAHATAFSALRAEFSPIEMISASTPHAMHAKLDEAHRLTGFFQPG